MTRALFQRFPSTGAIPHRVLADVPTPVERLPEASKRLGLADLWVKRDDRTSNLYGGNKLRKLEFLLADAVARGHDRVWTLGAIGSHHALATCLWAREIGLDCGVVHFHQPVTDHVRKNVLALSTTNPEVHLLGEERHFPTELFRSRLGEWLQAHPDEYYIPAGGSSGVGALGYVNAALELVDQVEAGECPRPDRIYVAAGTCGTLSGLKLGFALADFDVELVGVRVVGDWIANPAIAARLAKDAAGILADLGVDTPSVEASDFLIRSEFYGRGYGLPTTAGLESADVVREDGLVLEPTYTGKAFSAILADREELRDGTVLYWHTLSGADLTERVAAADLSRLPPIYAEWLAEEAEP